MAGCLPLSEEPKKRIENNSIKCRLKKYLSIDKNPPSARIEKIKDILRRDGCVDKIPPISCNQENGLFFIYDGNKRYLAAKDLGYPYLWGEF